MRVDVVQLFERYADGVYTLAARVLRDRHAAEDAVSDTFMTVLRRGDTYRGDGPIRAWVYRIAYRTTITALRKRREQPADPDTLLDRPDPSRSTESVALGKELAAVVDSAINSLDDTLRSAFVLRDVEELSTKETAAVLGITESAVKMRLARARQQMRASLELYLR